MMVSDKLTVFVDKDELDCRDIFPLGREIQRKTERERERGKARNSRKHVEFENNVS